MKHHRPHAPVIRHEQTGEDIFLLGVKAPEIAQEACPGQFVHIRVTGGYDPLLRRPLSICRVESKEGLILLWYQAVGKGTQLLSRLKTGETLDVVGPLGKGFDIKPDGKKVFLIGGGMGIAPLVFLADVMKEKNRVTVFLGGKNKGQLPPDYLLSSVECESATEDGSAGYRGLVTELMLRRLGSEKPDMVYACGPKGMLGEVIRITERLNLPLQISLEAVMACGVGACLGCTCEKGPSEGQGWFKVCQDGPVFWAQEVKHL